MNHGSYRRRGQSREGALRRHAQIRARQRIGINLGPRAHNAIVGQIDSGRAQHLGSRGKLSRYRVEHDMESLVVVFDSQRRLLVTIFRVDEQT